MKPQKKQLKISRRTAAIAAAEILCLRTCKILTLSKISIIRRSIPGLLVFFLLVSYSGFSQAADTVKGGELYKVHCALCHGVSGVNIMPNAPNFARGESMLQPDLSLLASIKNGKAAMPSYNGILSDQDILDVIVYLRTLN
jgi:cytochrome c6